MEAGIGAGVVAVLRGTASFDCRSKLRGVDAMVKFATAAPAGVNRSSGSAVRSPTMMMTVSPAMVGDEPEEPRCCRTEVHRRIEGDEGSGGSGQPFPLGTGTGEPRTLRAHV